MKIVIYTTPTCPYCFRAKALLKQKKFQFNEIDVSNQSDRVSMTKKANGSHTVPQIFINDKHIGGCDDLYILEREGKLDQLIGV